MYNPLHLNIFFRCCKKTVSDAYYSDKGEKKSCNKNGQRSEFLEEYSVTEYKQSLPSSFAHHHVLTLYGFHFSVEHRSNTFSRMSPLFCAIQLK